MNSVEQADVSMQNGWQVVVNWRSVAIKIIESNFILFCYCYY